MTRMLRILDRHYAMRNVACAFLSFAGGIAENAKRLKRKGALPKNGFHAIFRLWTFARTKVQLKPSYSRIHAASYMPVAVWKQGPLYPFLYVLPVLWGTRRYRYWSAALNVSRAFTSRPFILFSTCYLCCGARGVTVTGQPRSTFRALLLRAPLSFSLRVTFAGGTRRYRYWSAALNVSRAFTSRPHLPAGVCCVLGFRQGRNPGREVYRGVCFVPETS